MALEDFLPVLRLLDGFYIERQVLQIEVAFGSIGIVAIETVFFEECEMLFRQGCFGFLGGEGCDQTDED